MIDCMEEITIKQNNIIVLSCHVDQSTAGHTITSALLINNVRYPMDVSIVDDNNFNITIDTNDMPVCDALFDIKIGTISSETAVIHIVRNIA